MKEVLHNRSLVIYGNFRIGIGRRVVGDNDGSAEIPVDKISSTGSKFKQGTAGMNGRSLSLLF